MKDLLGVLSASLCIAHCLILPAAIAAGLPLAGMAVLSRKEVHLALSLLVVLLAVWAFPYGWFRHRQVLPGLLGLVAIGILVLTAFAAEVFEVYLATLGSFCLITAHLMNRHLLLNNVVL